MRTTSTLEEESLTSRRSRLALKIVITLFVLVGTYQTARGQIVPVRQVPGAPQWLVNVCLSLLGLALVAILVLTVKGRIWSALFAAVVLSSVAVAIVLFAYPTPDLWMLRVLWVGPVLYGAAAYFWEWSKGVEP